MDVARGYTQRGYPIALMIIDVSGHRGHRLWCLCIGLPRLRPPSMRTLGALHSSFPLRPSQYFSWAPGPLGDETLPAECWPDPEGMVAELKQMVRDKSPCVGHEVWPRATRNRKQEQGMVIELLVPQCAVY